jgi:hypothetical protein
MSLVDVIFYDNHYIMQPFNLHAYENKNQINRILLTKLKDHV